MAGRQEKIRQWAGFSRALLHMIPMLNAVIMGAETADTMTAAAAERTAVIMNKERAGQEILRSGGDRMRIRHANMQDLDRLAEIEAASYPAAEGASRQSLEGRLQYYPDHFWLLESDNGQITAFVNGFATMEKDLTDEMYDQPQMHDAEGDWQMIFSVVTDPRYRKQGYTGILLRQVISDAGKGHRKGIVLTCKERLIPFYSKFGFQNEGVSESVHGNVVWYQMRLTF